MEYVCPNCNKEFYQKSNLDRHLNKKKPCNENNKSNTENITKIKSNPTLSETNFSMILYNIILKCIILYDYV